MHADAIVHAIFLIFTGAAVLATLTLYARQALPVAYIALGLLLGPVLGTWGWGIALDPAVIRGMADVGIIFLLFLLGLNLEPQELRRLFREATAVTLVTCAAFWAGGAAIALVFGFAVLDAVLIGAAMMFSSTIIGLKLLPTSTLHHQRMGEIIVSILLLQDIIAILVLLLIQGWGGGDPATDFALIVLGAPALVLFAFVFSRYAITRLFYKFDTIREYIFLLAIGWCVGLAEIAEVVGLSYEIGAFVAGVSLATNPVARFIAESLKPLRDFFLIMFFFALGAGFDVSILPEVILPAAVLAGAAMLLKPVVFDKILERWHERPDMSRQIGVRLGQISEFSLLVAVAAYETGALTERGSYAIQAATILTFIASSYWIVLRYPTPVAVSDSLRQD